MTFKIIFHEKLKINVRVFTVHDCDKRVDWHVDTQSGDISNQQWGETVAGASASLIAPSYSSIGYSYKI